MARFELKAIPLITTGLFCFAMGAGAGIAWMTSAGYKVVRAESEPPLPPTNVMAPSISNPKNQMSALVVKLDLLTGKPLSLNLSDERREKIYTLLDGVEASVIPDEIVEERLMKLLQLVENDRSTLTAAGYRWPGGPIYRAGMEPNPFAVERNLEHLKSLRGKLAAKASTAEGRPHD